MYRIPFLLLLSVRREKRNDLGDCIHFDYFWKCRRIDFSGARSNHRWNRSFNSRVNFVEGKEMSEDAHKINYPGRGGCWCCHSDKGGCKCSLTPCKSCSKCRYCCRCYVRNSTKNLSIGFTTPITFEESEWLRKQGIKW